MLTLGCGKSVEPSTGRSPFLEVEKYFENEISSLQRSKKLLKKTIYSNSKSEQIIDSIPDWSNELAIFTSSITGKRLFSNSFYADTIRSGNQSVIHYTSKEKNAEIKKLSVYRTHAITDSIIILKSVENMYYTSLDTLAYYGNGNYRISAGNEPTLGKNISFVLAGTSLPYIY